MTNRVSIPQSARREPRRPLGSSVLSPFLAAALVIGALLAPAVSSSAAAPARPNIVWLISEDNSVHYLDLFFPGGAKTPRIAGLAEEGLVFEHAFSNSPVCSVARTTLMTGCYGPRIFTQFHRKSVLAPMPGDLRMFPAYLREAGYYTSNNRKKDYNAIEGKGVWDESSGRANWRGRKDGQPFFHMQSFGTTHESSLHFKGVTLRREKTETDPAAVRLAPYHPDTPTFRYTYARYHDRMRQVDAQIGAVVDRLRDDGLLEDTFVFYFGDHGGVLPRGKGYAYESGLHVPLVVRVPEKWRDRAGTGFARGTRVPGFVSFVDFGPTVLNLAGVDVPAGMDGMPFLGPGVAADGVNRRDEAFGYADRFDEKWDLVRTLRRGRFEYVRSYQPFNFDGLQNNYRYKMLAYQEWRELYRAGKLDPAQRQFFEPRAPEALYDLKADPHETVNLAADPAHAKTVADLRRRLGARVRGMPDLSFFPESVLAAEAAGDPVAFGRENRDRIARLADVADLSLLPFPLARAKIAQALGATDPWERYWALITCSTHGAAAAEEFADRVREIASGDLERLVRVRAAEFLGLTGKGDPRPVLREALRSTTSGVEAGLILNTVTLLRDGKPGYPFALAPADLNPAVRGNDSVKRRLEYLGGE